VFFFRVQIIELLNKMLQAIESINEVLDTQGKVSMNLSNSTKLGVPNPVTGSHPSNA